MLVCVVQLLLNVKVKVNGRQSLRLDRQPFMSTQGAILRSSLYACVKLTTKVHLNCKLRMWGTCLEVSKRPVDKLHLRIESNVIECNYDEQSEKVKKPNSNIAV